MRWILLALIAVTGFYFWSHRTIHHPPSVLVDHAPLQQTVSLPAWQKGDYTIQPAARYVIDARVLSKLHYGAHDHGDLVPYDLALGWQTMSDSAVLDQLDISQFGRYYQYRWQNPPPADPTVIAQTSANNHLIAANDKVAHTIARLRTGDVIHMEGYLVNASQPDGFHWNSSLTRDDTGPGACELMWVEKISVQRTQVP